MAKAREEKQVVDDKQRLQALCDAMVPRETRSEAAAREKKALGTTRAKQTNNR